jgi:IS30 family transposase
MIPFDEIELRKIRSMHEAGMPAWEIAQALDRSEHAIKRMLRGQRPLAIKVFEKPLVSRGHMTEEDYFRIRELYHAGYGARRIAKLIGRSEPGVIHVLRGRTKKAQRLFGGRLMHGRRPQELIAKN